MGKVVKIFALVLLSSAVLFPQEVIFSDDFESGVISPDWGTFWVGEDSLQIVANSAAPQTLENGGNYVAYLKDADGSYTGAALAVAGDISLSNYSVEADVYCYVGTGSSSSRYTGIVVYADTANNLYYKFVADFDDNMGSGPRLRFYNNKMDQNYNYSVDVKFYASDIPGGIPAQSGWHKLRVDVETLENSTRFTCYFDGQMVGDGPIEDDTQDRGSAGQFGFFSFAMGSGVDGYFDNLVVTGITSSALQHQDNNFLPENVVLRQNYPNPFNPSTLIRFDLKQPAYSRLVIYNLLGKRVRTLLSDYLVPGSYTFLWDGRNEQGQLMPSGVYFYTLQAGNEKMTRKMIFKK